MICGRAAQSSASFVLGVIVCIPAMVIACVRLSDAQQSKIARDQFDLSVCVAEGMAAKAVDAGAAEAWGVFDACMVRYGFYDAGRDAH